jgi:hypothetical protein
VTRADEVRIEDILDAAAEIAAVVAAGREIWDSDRVRQLAVERLRRTGEPGPGQAAG